MNKEDRKALESAVSTLSRYTDVEAVGAMTRSVVVEAYEQAKSIVEGVAESEREKFDNLNEGLQASEKGQTLEQNADTLEGINWPEVPEAWSDEAVEAFCEEVQIAVDEIEMII